MDYKKLRSVSEQASVERRAELKNLSAPTIFFFLKDEQFSTNLEVGQIALAKRLCESY